MMVVMLCVLLAAVLGGAPCTAVKVIIDTDLGMDVSNLVSVCIANAMMDRGEVELQAVLTSTGLPNAVGAISVVNHFYGHDGVPIGAYKGTLAKELDAHSYVNDLVHNFRSPIKNYTQVPEAHHLYRRVLSAQSDGSVVIASHGFLTNLQRLLSSTGDEYSELNGTELVAKKVRLVAIMGGKYPSSKDMTIPPGHEWNFGGGCIGIRCAVSSEATAYVVSHLPSTVPVVFSGYEVGARVHTGTRLLTGESCPAAKVTGNPCKQALADYLFPHSLHTWRESWDSVTSMFAIRGPQNFYTFQSGHVLVDPTDGSDVWSNASAVTGNQSYLVLNETTGTEPIATAIDDLLCSEPTYHIDTRRSL